MPKRPSNPLKHEQSTEFRLQIELVPAPLWGQNLRTRLGNTGWRKLRNALAAQSKPGCAICGSLASLQGHEVWDYAETEKTGIAALRGVEIRLSGL